MKTLRDYVHETQDKGVAIGHFNISNLEGLHGIYNAAKKLTTDSGITIPVIIGLSEGEEDFVGRAEAVGMIKQIRETDQYPIFLNADHHYSFERAKLAIDSGFDAVIIDGADKPHAENIAMTKQVVEYARSVAQFENRDILVEAEIGYIGSGSNIKETIPEGAGIKTTPEEAKEFADATGIDMLAPSVGSIHGLIKSGKPHIDAELVAEIKKVTGLPLVLHGGSGLRDEDFTNGIKAGIAIVHINTEIRVAFDEALKQSIAEHPNEVAPYKLLQPAVDAIQAVVYDRLKLFNHIV